MAISLTCDCGVLLEVDETFAGQTITCPDCRRALQVPAPGQEPRRTSALAITSLVLALAGAFTVVGTLLAAVLGGAALLTLKRQRDTLAGRGFAVAGLVLGLVLTGVTLFAYTSVELFGLDALLHEPQWAGKLDYDGPLEVERPRDGFSITRPSKDWGVLKTRRSDADFFPGHTPEGVLLVNPKEGAYVAVVPVSVPDNWTLEECRDKAKDEFARLDLASGDGPGRHTLPARVTVVSSKTLPDKGDTETAELVVVKQARRQERKFVLRVVRNKRDTIMYLVAGGARSSHFAAHEAELRRALDSFRTLERDRPAEWQNP
jgi:hypothetical protein